MCDQQTECLSKLLYHNLMMNTATPTDDATAAATETTLSLNEERAQISKRNRSAATQARSKGTAQGNTEGIGKPSSGENEGMDSTLKQNVSDDDNEDSQGNDDDEDDETSIRKIRERLEPNSTKRRRSKTDVDEYVPMTFPQKVSTIPGTSTSITTLVSGNLVEYHSVLSLDRSMGQVLSLSEVISQKQKAPHFPFPSCFTVNGDSIQRRKLRYHLLVT